MQVTPISYSNQKTKKTSFQGELYRPVYGEFAMFLRTRSNLKDTLRKAARELHYQTNQTLEVTVNRMPEGQGKVINAIIGRTKNINMFGARKENALFKYNDPQTGVSGKFGFYLNPDEDSVTNYNNLMVAMKDAFRGSFFNP